MEGIVSVKELATYLKLKESTVRQFALQGKLPAIKVGRRWRFKMEQVLMLLTEKKTIERADPNRNNEPPIFSYPPKN